jgi:hypothetical protein
MQPLTTKVTQGAMKVNMDVQVMSHTAAPSLKALVARGKDPFTR